MLVRNLRWLMLLSTALVCTVLTPDQLCAQATPVRSRAAELSAYVGYTNLTPDYGGGHNSGISVGADYMKYLPWLSPSLEVRFKTAPGGAAVGERTLGGGLRVEHQIKYFHPYGDLLVSTGTITFVNKAYLGANGTGSNGSIVYSYGGGVDYDFANQWAARVDFQSEHWNLDEVPAITLTPKVLTVGILYRFRFKKDRGE
jgi:hypothetical protein